MTEIIEGNEIQTLTSMEVAEMVGKEHKQILKDIRRYTSQLNEGKISPVDFWNESMYEDNKGETRPCYKVTKKGCEFIAHKLTGQKGTEFTARYINRFHEMQNQLTGVKDSNSVITAAQIERFLSLIESQQRIMEQLLGKTEQKCERKAEPLNLPNKEIEYKRNQNWVCVKEQVFGNQSRLLAKELGCSQNEAVGLLVRLWIWASNNVNEEGSAKTICSEDVESILSVGKSKEYDCDRVVSALISSGWINMSDGLLISDWAYWQDILLKNIKAKQNDKERKRIERAKKRIN